MEEKVKQAIDELRPFLMNDGGNIEFIKIENNTVYVNLQGACVGCPMREFTLKKKKKKIIKEKVPEVKEVKLINEN